MLIGYSQNIIGKVRYEVTIEEGNFVSSRIANVEVKGNVFLSSLLDFGEGISGAYVFAQLHLRVAHPIPNSQRRCTVGIGNQSGLSMYGVFTAAGPAILETTDDEVCIAIPVQNLEAGAYPNGIHFVDTHFSVCVI